MESWEGYEIIDNEIRLKWLSIDHFRSDPRLTVCGKCSSNCKYCSCGKKEIVCTLLCQCSATKCHNRINVCISCFNEGCTIAFRSILEFKSI